LRSAVTRYSGELSDGSPHRRQPYTKPAIATSTTTAVSTSARFCGRQRKWTSAKPVLTDPVVFDLLAPMRPNSIPLVEQASRLLIGAQARRLCYDSSILYQTSSASSNSLPVRSATPLRTCSISSSTSRLVACGPTTIKLAFRSLTAASPTLASPSFASSIKLAALAPPGFLKIWP